MPVQRPFPRLRLLTCSALALIVGLAVPVAATTTPGAPTPDQEPSGGAVGTADVPDGPTVTLVTGDRVTLHGEVDGQPQVSVTDAAGNPSRGFSLHQDEDGVHVVPHSVTALLPDVLDPDLFNVSRLVELGYDDESSDVLPLLVQTGDSPARATSVLSATGLDVDLQLDSIDAVAGDLAKDAAPQFLDGLAGGDGVGVLADQGATRVWLDGTVESTALDHYLEQVGAPAAWDLGLDGEGITVAVLDSGVDAGHPDLAGQVVAEQNFTDSPEATDRNGHGTHVASLAVGSGAGNDGERQGIAPGADLISGKVLGDTGEGQESWVIAGMEWAVDEGADVVNLSLSGTPDGQNPVDQALEALTADSGTLFVTAAGNGGSRTGGSYTIGTPGTAPSALTVGAVNHQDYLADFSSRGPTWGTYLLKPDIVAPGVELLAARAGARPGEDLYTPMSGTSMATPVVAGAAALLLQEHPDWTPQEVKTRLMSTSDGANWYTAWTHGAGRLDLPGALERELTSSRPNLDFEVLQWPHEGTVQETTELTNDADQEVTLDLSVTLADQLVRPAPDGAITVSPESATLAPGDSVEVTVSLDRDLLTADPWQGVLTADPADGGPGLRIPIGAYLEPESYQLNLQVLDAHGDPWDPTAGAGQPGADPTIPIFNGVTGGFIRLHPDENGQVSQRIPAGEWMVLARVYTPADGADPGTITVTGTAGLTVEEDTAYVLDARAGQALEPATVATQDTAPRLAVPFIYSRKDGSRGYAEIVYYDPQAVLDGRVRFTPTEPVGHGTFEAITRWWLEPTEAAEGDGDGVDAYDVLAKRPVLDPGLTPALTQQDLADRPRIDQVLHPVGGNGSYAVSAATGMGQIGALFGFESELATPGEREVLVAMPEDQVWMQCFRAAANDWRQLCGPQEVLQSGEHRTERFAATLHPVLRSAWHSEDTLFVSAGFSDGAHTGSFGLNTIAGSRLELQDAGGNTLESVADTYGYFRGRTEAGRFRLVQDLELVAGEVSDLSAVRTEWTFTTRPAGNDDGFATTPTFLDIDYGFDLAPEGTVGRRPISMDLRVNPTSGAADAERVTEVELAVSADDGATWQDLRARRTGDTTFRAMITPPVLRGADHLSFRVSATDAAGNAIEQTTTRLLTME